MVKQNIGNYFIALALINVRLSSMRSLTISGICLPQSPRKHITWN